MVPRKIKLVPGKRLLPLSALTKFNWCTPKQKPQSHRAAEAPLNSPPLWPTGTIVIRKLVSQVCLDE